VTIQRKGSEDLAKSSASAVDSSNLGQAPKARADFRDPTAVSKFSIPEWKIESTHILKIQGLLPFSILQQGLYIGGNIILVIVEWEDREPFHKNKTRNNPLVRVYDSPHNMYIGK